MLVQALNTNQLYLLRSLRGASEDIASATLEFATGRRVRSAGDSPTLYKLAARGDVTVANLTAERNNYSLGTYAAHTQALNISGLRQSVTAIRSALVAAAGGSADKAVLQAEILTDGATVLAGLKSLADGGTKVAAAEAMLANAPAMAPPWTASDRGFDVRHILSPTASGFDPRLDATGDFIERVDSIDKPAGPAAFWKSGPASGFASHYSGVIDVATGGSYTFFFKADDGAIIVVDGVQSSVATYADPTHQTMTTSLAAGAHTIEFWHQQQNGYGEADLEWQGPDSPARSQLTGANVIATSAYNAKRNPVGVPSLYKEMGQILTYEPTDSTAVVANLIASADRLLDEIISGETRVGSLLKRLEGRDQLAASFIEIQKTAVGSAVDANLEETAARLRTAQVRQSLAIRSLSIANHDGGSILKLLRGSRA